MNVVVKKIRLAELEDFVESKIYQEMEYKPISQKRAKSYLANPNAQAKDFVLYLGFIENKLIAFRSLLPDIVYSEDKQIRFAWCSGSWVHPNFRRKGFSELLLKEAYTDWSQKLMFTNYAPNSELLYLKTGWFNPIHQFNGIRVYLFPKTRKLIEKSSSNAFSKAFYSCVDGLIAIYSSVRIWFLKEKTNLSVSFETLDLPDEQCYKNTNQRNAVFRRGKKELQWIFGNPWLSLQKTESDQNYPFTSFSNQFYYKTVKVFSENNFTGFFLLSVRDGHLKTLYWNLPKGFEKEIANYIKLFCKNNKVEMATIYKKELTEELFKRKFPFLHAKKYGQKIYSTFPVKHSSVLIFQDGDGDVIFT